MYYIQELCSPTSAKSKRTPVRSPKDSCRTTRNKRQKMERPLFTNHRWFIAFQLLALLSMPTVISGTGSCTSLLTSPYSSMFSASTVSEGPGAPVINGTDVWCAGVVDEYQYLIVDLGKEMSIDRVAIQGYPGTTRSVSSYTLYTKRDGVYSSFQPVKVGYKIKLFQGSLMNGDSVKISDLPHTVTARYVKFNPREPLSPGSNDLCLRVDIQECSPVPIDGSWSEWSSWGVCTQDCLGVSTRYRTCDNPAPAHGGQSCIGQYSERKFCYNCPSPVDGDWSDWSPWSSCSASCDTGSATRTRSCTNPAPAHGGNDCVGSASEAGDCFVKNCPVHGDWSRWSPWSVCTLTCGGGIQFRSRACDNPIPEHGGNLCPGSSFEQTACNDQHCPIHGQWSDWGAWSSCGASCGGGTQSRSRACDNPAPQYGGLACSGTSSEIQQCNTHFCPIDGDWSAWSSWTTCDKTCGGGKTSRTRTCSNPAPQHGGSTCPGSTSQTLDCNTQSCPIHGGWSSWSSWSSCSKSCDGIQSRSRLCNSPPPDFGGSPCVGSPSDTQHCNLDVCPDPIDGGWSVWGMWSQCSQPCYGGSRSRSRDCTSPPPMHGGKNCQGNSVMREDCKRTCPVIGEWSSWSQWSSCSETCGSGTKFRRRTCTNPPPSHGGVDCSGQNSDYMACKDRDCPVDGQYSSWTQWTSCNVTCGGGSRVRDRKCDNPPPSSGGKACVGGNFQVEICNNNVCPVDGVWSSWSSWSSCDKVCGGGSQYRSRSCNNPKPASGGQPCTGKSVENQICNTNKCPLDGAWTNWSDGPCSVTCGQGKRNRTRTCTDPSPSGGGQPCPSVSYKTEDCNSGPCPSTAAPPTGTTPKVNAGIPEIDLVFVINVGGVDGAATFQLIKNSIKSIASIYGLARIRYGVVLYGSVATTRIDFSTSFTDLRSFKNAIDSLRANSAGSNLGEALEIAKELFSGPGARPNSKKVIVVIGNQTPVTDSSRLTSLAKTLSLLGIKIVSVGIGDSINLLKFQEIATRGKANLLSVDINISAVILGERIMRLVLIDDIPEIDLVFALSATSANKTETYTLMKETIKQIIDRYGTDKIQYSVIVFGSGATTIIYFNHTFPVSPAALKAAVDALPSTTGGPALDTALEEAKRLFDQIPVSSDGQKILVIIADKKSNLGDSVLTTAVRPLENQGILVISVGIGSEIDSGELKVLSPNPLDVIIASIYENPAVLAVRIMERVLRIRTPFLDLGFAMSATSVNSDAIFSLMKEIIKAIIDRYGTDKVHISVIVYGNVTTRSFNFGSAVPDQDQLKKDVDNLKRVPGPPNLEDALREARRLFQAITVRANAKKVFVVLTDSSRTQDVNSLRRAAANLRRDGILILTAGFGDQVNQIGNQMRVLTITPTDYIGVPNYNTERPVVIAEAIMYKATLANIPEIDLTFALSATSASADRTFTLMQRTVNKVVEEYGINRIHYSIIVFGRVTTTPLDFSRTLPNKEVLSNLVNRLQRNPGRPDLVRALEEVNRIYQLQPVRPNALKVLVVIMDNPTISDASSLNRVVTVLVNRSVIIIGVGVGPSVNRTELEIITREVQNVIRVNVNKDANELAREIIQLILRTSGFSQWGQWGACSRTCRYLGVAGRQVRRRTCRNAALGCVGSLTETRQCNEVDCFGCGKTEGTFTASSSLDQNTDATVAGLNTTNPSASRSAWCSRLNDDSKYIQLDLVQAGQVYQVASKGKEEASQLWVTAYYVSYSTDGTTFTNYTENGQLRVFSGNSDATSVVVNSLNITDGVSQVRFHPLRWEQQQTASPCMQVAVFACTVAGIGPTAGGVGSQQEEAGEGVLIALWILAGILTFLLLLACLWYCCRLCCGRGKKRKRFTSFRDTSTDTGYLLDQEKKWKLGQGVTGALKDRAHHEDEVQEVTVEMKEEAVKPGGVIQFGIETEEAKVGKDKFITAETVHSETPYYSEDVGTIKSGASMMTVGSDDTGYRSTERRKRIKSETRASVGDVAATSEQWSHRAEQRSSAFTNGGYMRSQEWFAEPVAEARAMDAGIAERKVRRSQSLDELGAVDYNMFERRRASAQAGDSFGVQSGRGGYYRFDQSGRESVDTTDGSFRMGTVDVAIGGLGDLDMGRRSSRPYAALDEQEMMTFRADNGGRSVYTLDNGGYHTEEWYTRGGVGPGQMREEGFKEIHVEHTPIYTDAQGNNQGFVHVRRV